MFEAYKMASSAQQQASNALEETRVALKERIDAQERTNRALKETTAAQEKTVEAQARTADELIRYTWVDLGARRQEAIRLTDLARRLGRKPEDLLPDAICANPDCTITKKQQPGDFDCQTYLKSGFRYLYCSVRSIVSFDKVQTISGLSIFGPGGPHDNNEVNLGDPVRFGHYNPDFLYWVESRLIPDRNDAWFRGVTQLVYDAQIGPLARALYRSHEILFSDPQRYASFVRRYKAVQRDYLEQLRLRKTNLSRFKEDPISFEEAKVRYQKRIDEKSGDIGDALQEDFRWLSDYLATERGDDWYLANTAGGFWVRRSLDGTEAQIFRMTKKILLAFEPAVLSEP
jgi:hypothetical protein